LWSVRFAVVKETNSSTRPGKNPLYDSETNSIHSPYSIVLCLYFFSVVYSVNTQSKGGVLDGCLGRVVSPSLDLVKPDLVEDRADGLLNTLSLAIYS